MKATDLPLLKSVSAPTIDPTGARAVVAVTRPNLDADAYVGQLWSIATDGSTPPRRITRGVNDSAPRFSPDGALIGFLRREGDSPAQVYVMSAGGGEPVQVTDAPLGVSSFRWSPGSTRIAFVARVPEDGRYGTVKELGAAAEPPRHLTALKYRANGVGYISDRRNHVFLVDVPDPSEEPVYSPAPSAADPSPEEPKSVPEATQVTSGDFDHGPIEFSPDGTRLALIAARHATRDDDLIKNVFELDLTHPDAPLRELTTVDDHLSIDALAYLPDGGLYLLASDVGEEGRDFVGRLSGLYRLGVGERPVRLTDPESVDLGEVGSAITVLADGSALVQKRTRGLVELHSVSTDAQLAPVAAWDAEITGHAHAAGVTVVSFTSPETAGDVAVLRDGGSVVLTNFSAELLVAGIAPTVELEFEARDGYPLHGWLVLPRGEGPHPVLLNIHGGPFAQYTVSVFDEAQVYADAGYAVLMSNPRGSAGYGEAHGRSIRQAMGTLDMTDVLDFLEGALERHPELDADRVGIMGGSYGGYLTAWTIAHEHRFAAAIVERGYLDPEGFVGTSDIGMFFGDEYTGVDPELVKQQSPQAVVDRVTTPTFVVHSEEDLRCPLPQAERYYAALKRQGTDAELLIFPGENHELSRSGRPRHRVQRFDAILDWWSRHLPVSRAIPTEVAHAADPS